MKNLLFFSFFILIVSCKEKTNRSVDNTSDTNLKTNQPSSVIPKSLPERALGHWYIIPDSKFMHYAQNPDISVTRSSKGKAITISSLSENESNGRVEILLSQIYIYKENNNILYLYLRDESTSEISPVCNAIIEFNSDGDMLLLRQSPTDFVNFENFSNDAEAAKYLNSDGYLLVLTKTPKY